MDKGLILGVIQVRMASTRLPGKALKEVMGRPLLWYLYERMTFSKMLDKIVIATADNASNLPIIEFAKRHKIDCYAGSEEDIIDRYYQTAKRFNGRILVKITGDCPLTDPEVIDRAVRFYISNQDRFEYVSTAVGKKETYPDGLDVGVVPFKTIEKAWREIKDPFWREWMVGHFNEHPDVYRIGSVESEKNYSHLRWTVDHQEDLEFVDHIFNRLYPSKKRFLMNDILELLEKEPWLTEINRKYSRNAGFYESRKEAGK